MRKRGGKQEIKVTLFMLLAIGTSNATVCDIHTVCQYKFTEVIILYMQDLHVTLYGSP